MKHSLPPQIWLHRQDKSQAYSIKCHRQEDNLHILKGASMDEIGKMHTSVQIAKNPELPKNANEQSQIKKWMQPDN